MCVMAVRRCSSLTSFLWAARVWPSVRFSPRYRRLTTEPASTSYWSTFRAAHHRRTAEVVCIILCSCSCSSCSSLIMQFLTLTPMLYMQRTNSLKIAHLQTAATADVSSSVCMLPVLLVLLLFVYDSFIRWTCVTSCAIHLSKLSFRSNLWVYDIKTGKCCNKTVTEND